jgi:hypothetical protein
MVSSAEALSNVGREFVFRDSEQWYVRRVTMSARDAVLREHADPTEPLEAKPEWLKESASRLVEFTRLPQDWDLEGGDPVDPFAAQVAYVVLCQLASNVDLAPDIVPVGDGGVMVEWHTPSADLEIEVGPDFEGSVFFRDRSRNIQVQSTRLRAVFNSLSRLGASIQSAS